MVRRIGLCLLILVSALQPVPAAAKRLALVLGIGDYQHLSSLANPVVDAKAIAASLREHGFEVSDYYNLDRADLLDALEKFKREAAEAEVALIYYAGHGMEIERRNVIAPVDMQVQCENKTTLRAVPLDDLFTAASSAPQQIVLLDACRNDPFPQCPTRGAGEGSGFRGFSRVTEEDRSLLIANATLSGKLAADGAAGEHSPFAKALLANFKQYPRTPLRDLLDLTAREVRVATQGVQVPEITTQGGAPRICLDATGCGMPVPSAEGTIEDPASVADAKAILAKLGFMADRTRGEEGGDALAEAIKRFQARSGLPVDGKLTPTLLTVLRVSRTQVAALPLPAKPGVPSISAGPSEHTAGSVFKDCETCPEMVALPAGRFIMGASNSEKGRQASETPQREVAVQAPFAVAKTEITFDEWEACALEGGCAHSRPNDGNWGRARRPVIYVSYDDAKSYVDWLRQKTGKPYRLLSEAEWEYAARGGTSTAFAGGETLTPTQANFDASSITEKKRTGSYEGKTVEAGSFPSNPFGLHDMEGNVLEWVEDCWNDSHKGGPADAAPRGGDCARRVAKGGAWYYEADYARPSARMSFPKGSRLNVIGFRVARPLE